MCGIVGILGAADGSLADTVCMMRDSFPYRGPDAKDFWVSDSLSIALGHVRLSIIDLRAAGNQPMGNAQTNQWIVYNGEIYNYIELREELKRDGFQFQTDSDTEVLMACYERWGSECLKRLNGMWAFAIWDENEKQLFIARDRLGIKPFYYLKTNECFYFASEIKAILAILKNIPETAAHLIDPYMSFGYIPGEDTLISGIKRLLPGHFIRINFPDLQDIQIKKYWDLKYENNKDLGLNYYVNRSRELLHDAINLRLRSDVPLGVFLSGGIDSSAVVGLLAQKVSDRLKTFSVAYDFGDQYNETPYAQMVAKQFHTEHHEFFVSHNDFQGFIPDFVWFMDEPVAESAAISLFFIAKLAKRHVTVVLSGEGADEVFAGYDFYRYMNVIEMARKTMGAPLLDIIASLARRLLPVGNKIQKYLTMSAMPLEKRYRGISTHDENYKKTLYSKDFSRLIGKRTESVQNFLENLFLATKAKDSLSRMLYFDMKTWLVDDLLIKADRMSMANSLELRVPFLDYRLVEFSAQIPSKYKINGNTNKFILKQMMKSILPPQVVHRKKMGFPTPLKIMLKKNLKSYAFDLLLSPNAKMHAYFEKKGIHQLLHEHTRSQMDHHKVIWQLIVLENWLQASSIKRQLNYK